jgi:transposase-like protein
MACKACPIPLRTFLGLARYQRKTSELEKMVAEVISEQSYRRGSDHLERIGEIPVPKSTVHRWVMASECDDCSPSGQTFDQMLADGTGFKRRFVSGTGQTNRGELCVLLGITPKGTTVPLGAWSGKSWEQIGEELKSQSAGGGPKADVLVSDGEAGLAEGLSAFFSAQQRCHWHATRDLDYTLWQDGVSKDQRRKLQEDLALVLAVEIPKEDIEPVTTTDRKELQQYVVEAEDHIETMIRRMNRKGYVGAAGYLRRMKDNLFTYMRRWLATGLVSPRVSSWIERVMREIARRLKRMAFGWSEQGAEKMTRIVLKRFTDRQGWEAWWKKRLRLNDNVLLVYRGVKAR